MTTATDSNTIAATVKAGHLLSSTEYLKVLKVRGSILTVKNIDTGLEFNIHGEELINQCASADVSFSEERTTMTKVAELLVSSFNVIFTVCFVKKNGEERVLRGRLIRPEPILGRSNVMDLDNGPRLVDHRTIKWLIVNGVKYIVK